jgi:D-aspartate ligase
VSGGGQPALPRAVILDPHDGGLALARRLIRRRVPVVVLSNASSSWIARSRGVAGIELPSLADAEERWLEQIGELAGGGDGVLIPCSDRASALVAEHREAIPASMRSFESADGVHLRLMNKATLYEAAERAGVRYPWTRVLDAPDDLASAAREADFPCLLKPTLSHEWRRLFGEDRVFVIDSPDALVEKAGPALAAGLTLLLSEHVPGPETALEGHVAVRLADGSYALEYTRRKLRQYPLDFGAAATMMSDVAPRTRELSRALLDSSGFVGLASVEAKLHALTGEPVLIEVNVRVPQSFGLGDAARTDAAYRVYSTLAGLALGPPPAPRNGVKSVVPALEFRAARERLRRGDVGRLELLASYRGVREVGVLDPRDPGPGLALAMRVVRSRLRRALSARRRAGA